MSIGRMQRRMSRHLRIVLYVIIAVFIVGLPLVFVPRFANRPQQPETAEDGGAQVVATVDGKPVSRSSLEGQFERTMAQLLPFYASLGQGISFEQIWPYRLNAMEQAIAEELLVRQAEANKLSVSRKEVKARAQQLADEELGRIKEAVKPEELELVLARIVAETDGTLRDQVSERRFRDWSIERLLEMSDSLRNQLLVGKLRQGAVGSVTATEQELLAQYDRATVREIRVSLHPEGKPERTEEEARRRAEGLVARARKGEDFARLARAESDDPDARETGGLLESVGRQMMPAEWAGPVFALGPDEVSDPIKGQWGYSVVKMEKLERELPDDFESKKEQLLMNLVQQNQNSAWMEYQQGLREKAQVKVVDPEMLAWQALQGGKQEEALAKLQEAAGEQGRRKGLATATVSYRLGKMLEAREQWEAALEAYESSYDSIAGAEMEPPGGRAEALMSMAKCHERLGNVEEALDWYQTASGKSEVPSVHAELQGTFERLGREDLAAGEREWLDDYRQAELERQKEWERRQQQAEEQQGER